MSVQYITFIKVEKVEKVSTKSGKPYAYVKLEGVAHEENGSQSVFRYDFWPIKDQPLPNFSNGDYVPIYGCAPHWETAKLEPRFMDFRPVAKKAA